MKKIYTWALGVLVSAACFTGCVDKFAVGDDFLEKQPGVDVTIDTVFEKAEYARMFLWDAYKTIYHGFATDNVLNTCNTLECISDVVHGVVGWGGVIETYYSAMHSEAGNTGWVRDKFAFMDNGGRKGIWNSVRKCWLFIQNVDRVPDMNEAEKQRLKAEAMLIIATRYYDAFTHFGGLPLVDHAYATDEIFTGGYTSAKTGEGEFVAGRATVEQTVTFIDNLIQRVIDEPELPFYITDYSNEGGRLTKAGAYGLRVKLWLFAASPLFNSESPYRKYDNTPTFPEGFGNDVDPLLRVWWGKKDNTLWTKCLQACEAFFKANSDAGNPFALRQYCLRLPSGLS